MRSSLLLYNLRLAALSLRRTPWLTLVTLTAIGLGVSIATTCVTIDHLLTSDPLPGKSDRVYMVRLDSWSADFSFSRSRPEIAPDQLTHRDAVAVLESEIPTYAAAMFNAEMVVHPESRDLPPRIARARLTTRDFFPMFDVPFLFGGPWDDRADADADAVVVLDYATNDRLFGGEDSVGRRVRIEQRDFTVAGVLQPWRPHVRFYEARGGAQERPEEIYLPFSLAREMEVPTNGNTYNWGSENIETYADFLASESVWVQMWAQLDSPEQSAEYLAFLDAYTISQGELGRFQRPTNNYLHPLLDYLDEAGAVPPTARTFSIISLLFLAVCSINLIGLLLGKFLARAPQVGVRRALGASRRAIFTQHLVECQVVAIAGGLLGLAGAAATLRVVNSWLEETDFSLTLGMVTTGVGLALVAGALAGVYPAWRVCAVAPAEHLKQS